MNRFLEKYRELVKTDKAIACFYIVAKVDKDGILYADLNAGWVIGLLNADESLLEAYMEDEYQIIEDFEINEPGQYEIEAVLESQPEQRSFAAPVQPDFKAYYELEYYEIISKHPLEEPANDENNGCFDPFNSQTINP